MKIALLRFFGCVSLGAVTLPESYGKAAIRRAFEEEQRTSAIMHHHDEGLRIQTKQTPKLLVIFLPLPIP